VKNKIREDMVLSWVRTRSEPYARPRLGKEIILGSTRRDGFVCLSLDSK